VENNEKFGRTGMVKKTTTTTTSYMTNFESDADLNTWC
jgi:hypothetical protein